MLFRSGVASVIFDIGGVTYPGYPVSNISTQYGTWRYNFTLDRTYLAYSSNLSLVSVKVVTSVGDTCVFTAPTYALEAGTTVGPQSFGTKCYGSFKAPNVVENRCSCTYTTSDGPKQPDNTYTQTLTPNSSCQDQTIYGKRLFTDYCDPLWTAGTSGCMGTNLSSPEDILAGTAQRTYSSGYPSCRSNDQATAWYNHNTGSDQQEPIDNLASFGCRQDIKIGRAHV